MSLIAPNTTLRIYSGVPLDNTYEHTLYWSSKGLQDAYFHNGGLEYYQIAELSYQRVSKGIIRVQFPINTLYKCNYMAFKNNSFVDKWFYAFITKVEYVNNITCDLYYEIDVMQTYFFDVELKECFVDREHTSTDTIGAHILDEPVSFTSLRGSGVDQYIFDDYSTVFMRIKWDATAVGDFVTNYCGASETTAKYAAPVRTAVGKGATGGGYITIMNDDEDLLAYPDSLINMYTYPTEFIPDVENDSYVANIENAKTVSKTFHVDRPDNLNGYTPKNNKLFTYPYMYLHVTGQDCEADFRYEFFRGGYYFAITGGISPTPVVICSPRGYDSHAIGVTNFIPSLYVKDFPQIPWVGGAYQAWSAQVGSTRMEQGLLSTGAGAVSGAMNGGVVGAAAGFAKAGIQNELSFASQEIAAKHAPNSWHGSFSGGLLAQAEKLGFRFECKCLTYEEAQSIDDYFSKYGYKCNQLKVPNRNVRPCWTYTRTIDCVVVGECPQEDIFKICSIYNNGITFWNNPANVGNYSLDNSVM